tara:strand:- start:253643 stop:254347 length:705 start_codon:yes stop_codon:yes gene_type:complete
VGQLNSAPGQLSLAVQLRDDATLDNFLPTPALQPLVKALSEQSCAAGESVIFVYGPPGSGKSHLLQASCHLVPDAQYLPLADLSAYSPDDVLQSLETRGRLCIDDIDAVLGQPDWENALFHLYNRARDRGCNLLLSAAAAPRALDVDLDDLRSRLAWGLVFQLPAPDDARRAAILRFRAARRGLELPQDVASYIVHRAPRGMYDLLEVLSVLDLASLREQRALSIPFIKRILGW